VTLVEEGQRASLVERARINIVPKVFEYLFGVRLHMENDEIRHRRNGKK
jgi:hypothetical protein